VSGSGHRQYTQNLGISLLEVARSPPGYSEEIVNGNLSSEMLAQLRNSTPGKSSDIQKVTPIFPNLVQGAMTRTGTSLFFSIRMSPA